MITLDQGENFILSVTLQDADEDPIPVASFQSLEIRAMQNNQLKKSWTWFPTVALSDEHMTLTAGLCLLEVDSSVTAKWIGVIHFQVIPSMVNGDYFVSGAQTDVVCFDDLVTFEKC